MNVKRDVIIRGFTLIELLIVIAVLGILATAILVSLDPVEQMNRGRDSGRMSTVTQLGKATQAYYTSVSNYPTENNTWQTTLRDAGEIQRIITLPAGGSTCAPVPASQQGRVCYTRFGGTTDAAVWTLLQSKWARTKAGPVGTPCAAPSIPAAIWIASQGKAGYGCLGSAATAPTAGQALY